MLQPNCKQTTNVQHTRHAEHWTWLTLLVTYTYLSSGVVDKSFATQERYIDSYSAHLCCPVTQPRDVNDRHHLKG